MKNKLNKNPTLENQTIYERCDSVSLRKKNIKNYFNDCSNNNVKTNQNFLKFIKIFLKLSFIKQLSSKQFSYLDNRH